MRTLRLKDEYPGGLLGVLRWFRARGGVFWFTALGGGGSIVGLFAMFVSIAESQELISFDFLRAKPNLFITLSASPQTAVRDGELTYTVRITNNGSGISKRIVAETALPDGVTFVSSDPGAPACFEARQVVNCRLGALDSGQHVEAVVVVKVQDSAPETLAATATVETSNGDSNLSDNSVNLSTPVK